MRLRRTRLSDDVVLLVAREIVRGAFKRGVSLSSEPELAARFGISRPVVRESIQALAAIGMVDVQQGKRTVVQDETQWDVLATVVQSAFQLEGRGAELAEDFYEVRLILETNAAARAAEHASEQHRDRLMEMAQDMAAIARGSRDLAQFLAIDREFHATIARAAGNVVLSQVIRNIHGFLSSAWTNSRVTPDELEAVADQHTQIAEAIMARRPERSRRATEAHISWAQKLEIQRNQAADAATGRRTGTRSGADRVEAVAGHAARDVGRAARDELEGESERWSEGSS